MASSLSYWKTGKQVNPFIKIGEQVQQLTNKGDIILSDIPWEVTWYADRRTIWLPYDLDTLKNISTTLKPKYALLTGRQYAVYKDNIWVHMLNDREYARTIGFEFQGPVTIGGNTVALLFRAVPEAVK
jgi:hypothetical protein